MLTVDILKTISADKTEFVVPEDYFKNLSTTIIEKIKALDHAEELRNLSPMLYAVQNENVFQVPPGYFSNLENSVLSKVVKPKAKVVTIKKNFVWKYAAAAVITGVIGVSSLMVLNKSQNISDPENGITSYIQQASQFKNETQINDGIAKLSDDEIIKYLETTGNVSDNDALTQGIEEKELPAQNEYLNNDQTLLMYLNTTDTKEFKN